MNWLCIGITVSCTIMIQIVVLALGTDLIMWQYWILLLSGLVLMVVVAKPDTDGVEKITKPDTDGVEKITTPENKYDPVAALCTTITQVGGIFGFVIAVMYVTWPVIDNVLNTGASITTVLTELMPMFMYLGVVMLFLKPIFR